VNRIAATSHGVRVVWTPRRDTVEVGGQVLIGIAAAVGDNHPDLLAAELLTQRLEHADFVGDAVDALAPVGSFSLMASRLEL
jgi:hypothetical protein